MLDLLAYISATTREASFQELIQYLYLLTMLVRFLYCWFLQECLLDLPSDDQRAAPWSVWLMFMPFLELLFMWLLIPYRIPDSFRSFFERHGFHERHGDCGRKQGFFAMACFSGGLVMTMSGQVAVVGALLMMGVLFLLLYTWRIMKMRREVRRYHRAAVQVQRQHHDDQG